MKSELVSVVMSVYNAEAYLKESINSILSQNYKNFEFIIVNDGSTDSSLDIIKSFDDERIIIVDQHNTGLAKALNNGISKAKGKYIARMDADDISIFDRLSIQVAFLENNLDHVIVGSNANFIDQKGDFLYSSKLSETNEEIALVLPNSPFFHSSTLFRKESFIRCKGYNEKIKHHFEDRILWNEMSKIGKLHNVKSILLEYRIVPTGISNRNKETALIFNEICNKIILSGIAEDKDVELLEKISQKATENEKLANYYLRVGKIFIEYNFNRKKAISNLFYSLKYQFFNKITWFNLFLSFMPKPLIVAWKNSRGVNN